ncbi:MAG: stage II sporulation protein M [Candidatus Spechtbacterales bacterium]|nr:stage II sporulation protein M [Candidatus Spechtbacterales bacterium]
MDYIKTLTPRIKFVTIWFLGAILAGYATLYINPAYSDVLLGLLGDLEGIAELSKLDLFLFIFFNNAVKMLAAIVLGIFFGIIPFLMVLINGYLIGGVVYLGIKAQGLFPIIVGILPHGILEIPIFLICVAMGLAVASATNQSIKDKSMLYIKTTISKSTKIFFVFLLPLIFVAALIESYITSWLLGMII